MKNNILKLPTVSLLAAVILASCSNTALPASNIDNVTVAIETAPDAASISEQIDTCLTNASKLTAVGDEYLIGMLELDMAQISEYVLKIQTSGTESDQYGIFKAVDADAAKLLSGSIGKYLEMLKSSWEQFDYLPEEGPKIRNAEVKQKGRYVLYIIASDTDKKDVIEVFNSSVG